jgi:RNA polymerase sigma-70 factor, ECF subfamily
MREDVANDLLDRIKRKDPAAWESVYLKIYPRLRGYAAKRVGQDHASDIVAETMARAVGSIERFDPTGVGLSAWIFGICRHVIADRYRAAERDRRQPVAPLDISDDIGAALEGNEEAQAMKRAYRMLSDDDREILDLRVIGGLTAEDVGTLLDRKPGAVRMAQSRALDRLREHFKEVYR